MSTFEKILLGMQIIKEFDSDAYFCAEHDQIWCGDSDKASEEQKQQLDELDWFISEDSFSHWV